MSGLYTRFNLSEQGINATDAVQKLYSPPVQDDINLFAFSSKLKSFIQSPENITGFVNESFLQSRRTKFVTEDFTFSDGNNVWFDYAGNFPVVFSSNGSLADIEVIGNGSGYKVTNSFGAEPAYPYQLNVRAIGLESESRDAVIQITVESDGRISSSAEVVSPGSKYKVGEILEIIPSCKEGETPTLNKCVNYNNEYVLKDSPGGHAALLLSKQYTYTVKSSARGGFFLYDDRKEEWVNLGSEFDSFRSSDSYLVRIDRSDTLNSKNLSNLFGFNFTSYIFSYRRSDQGAAYRASETLSEGLQEILNRVESVKSGFSDYIQNLRTPRSEEDEDEGLSIRYNIFTGQDLITNSRVIFRDPDNSLEVVDYSDLSTLSGPKDYKLEDITVPGIWVRDGDRYSRIFSNDNKPFVNLLGKLYLNPRIYNPDGEEATLFKYSISASAYNASGDSSLGFDTTVGTLVQNISQDADNGGFVYYRTLVPITLNQQINLKSWPLLSYKNSLGQTKEAMFLAV
jgi:hypothetical protein